MQPIGDWAGRLLGGRYKIELAIDQTLSSRVFKAWDCQGRCWVVVKIVSQFNSSDPGSVLRLTQRLRREGAALQRLQHPRIVRCLDFGKEDGFFFLVLEYLSGPDLCTVIRFPEYSLIQETAISYGVQILEGLEVMHAAGMVHRDLKPANVMVVPGGVKIIDLGMIKLAKRPGPRRRNITEPGTSMGTLFYLSPEQRRGALVDVRSDVYACGVILYELLVRQKPFYTHADLEWREWKKSHPEDWWFLHGPLRPFPYIFGVPKKVQEVVWKALAVDPDDRFQTAKEMRLALLAARPFSLKRYVGELVGGVGGKIRSAWQAIWS